MTGCDALRYCIILILSLSIPIVSFAKCGSVDYSWGADALATAHDYCVTMMLYIIYIVYAVAGVVAVIGALQIYVKMQTGEGDVVRSVLMLIGACIFLIGASIVMPSFFGYSLV